MQATVEAYLRLRQEKGLAAKTLELERWRAGLVLRGLGRMRVQSLSVADCDAFLRAAAAGELSTSGGGRGQIGTASPYELRHTVITLQAEAGHSAWAIADWAGTSERMIADVYRHKLADTSLLGPAI